MDMIKTPEQREADKKLGAILDAVGTLNSALKGAGMVGGVIEIRLPRKGMGVLQRTLEIVLTNGFRSPTLITDDVTLLDNVRFTVQPEPPPADMRMRAMASGIFGRIADA